MSEDGVYQHDPDAKLDYAVNWAAWLGDDTIASSDWVVPAPLVLEETPAPSYNDTATTAWISGGEVGARYRVVNRIVTAAGRVDDRTVTLVCMDR